MSTANTGDPPFGQPAPTTPVNPAHLFLGTQQENLADMMEKGRSRGNSLCGEEHGAKLTEDQVTDIRRDYVRGSRTHGQPALARKYGVDHTAIGFIVRGETWK